MKFYICTKSNWQGDSFSPAGGPYATRKDAEAHLAEYRVDGDIRDQIHACVFSRSQMREIGYPLSENGEYQISEDLWSAFVAREEQRRDEAAYALEMSRPEAYA